MFPPRRATADFASTVAIPALPHDAAAIAAAGACCGLEIPSACMPGVVDNLAVLERHAATLLGRAASAS